MGRSKQHPGIKPKHSEIRQSIDTLKSVRPRLKHDDVVEQALASFPYFRDEDHEATGSRANVQKRRQDIMNRHRLDPHVSDHELIVMLTHAGMTAPPVDYEHPDVREAFDGFSEDEPPPLELLERGE